MTEALPSISQTHPQAAARYKAALEKLLFRADGSPNPEPYIRTFNKGMQKRYNLAPTDEIGSRDPQDIIKLIMAEAETDRNFFLNTIKRMPRTTRAGFAADYADHHRLQARHSAVMQELLGDEPDIDHTDYGKLVERLCALTPDFGSVTDTAKPANEIQQTLQTNFKTMLPQLRTQALAMVENWNAEDRGDLISRLLRQDGRETKKTTAARSKLEQQGKPAEPLDIARSLIQSHAGSTLKVFAIEDSRSRVESPSARALATQMQGLFASLDR